MKRHITLEISDELAKMIASDIKVPYTVVDKHTPFDKPKTSGEITAPHSVLLDKKAKDELFNGIKDNLSGPDDDTTAEIARGISAVHGELIEVVAKLRDSRVEAEEKNLKWTGPSEDEIKAGMSRADWDAAVHCEWLRVVLRDRFSLELNSPSTAVDGVKVSVSATGEAWLKHWYVGCVDHCGPWDAWCCHWHSGYKWTRVASITKHNIHVAANSKLTFSAADGSVFASPRFTKLRLDYDILREIPLEDVANWLLGDQNIAVLTRDDLAVEIESLGLQYRPSEIQIPTKKGALVVHVEVASV